jgi:hypothetical protein
MNEMHQIVMKTINGPGMQGPRTRMLILDHFSPNIYGEELSNIRHSQIIEAEQKVANKIGPPPAWTNVDKAAADDNHRRGRGSKYEARTTLTARPPGRQRRYGSAWT